MGMVLSKMLLKYMQEKQLNFVELAKRSGVSKSTIHGWTTGRRVRNLAELRRVAEILEISIHQLIFGEADPYEKKSQEILKELFAGDVRVTIHKIEKPPRQ